MTTISFSVEDSLKRDIERWAKAAKKSKSKLLKDMALTYRFNEEFEKFQARGEKVLADLGIETEEELFDYLESDQIYEDRLRQQRLSRGGKKK